MGEKKLTENESLLIIEQMIGRARQEERDSGWGWIVWGWLLFVTSVAHFVLIRLKVNHPSRVWDYFLYGAILLVLLSILARYWGPAKGRVRTYTNELVDKFGFAFFVSLVVMSYGNYVTDLNPSGTSFGYLLLLYAFWMYIHGSAYRFALLRYGAYVNWLGAMVIFYFGIKLGANVLLVHAVCVALGYLVPGHIALRKFQKRNSGITHE